MKRYKNSTLWMKSSSKTAQPSRYISILFSLYPGCFGKRSNTRTGLKSKLISSILLFVLLFFFLFSNNPFALDKEILAIWAGLDVFPSMLAADTEITSKKGSDGRLLLIILCKRETGTIGEMADSFRKIGTIREIPIRVEVSTYNAFFNAYGKGVPPAGIFLAEKFDRNELKSLIAYSRKNHLTIFSPFEGDVEQGVLGGIIVSDRVLPYINLDAMRLSKIKIKEFFLKVSEKYE